MHVPQNKQRVAMRLLDYLHEKMLMCNSYVQDFKTAYELAERVEAERGEFRIGADGVAQRPSGEHQRRYNVAEGLREVQVLIPDEGSDPPRRDIVLRPRGGNEISYVQETHRSYDPLHYTLFFPDGREDGWNLGMGLRLGGGADDDGEDDDSTNSQRYRDYYNEVQAQRAQRSGRQRVQLTARDFYAFHLHERADERTSLLRGGRAFQEYLCMAFAKVGCRGGSLPLLCPASPPCLGG